MDPRLDGVRLKVKRAEKHLADLNTAIQSWNSPENKPDSAIVYPDSEWRKFDIAMDEVRESDPMWSAMVGDVIHNLRSALDHLVCQLALLEGHPVSCCAETSFPICRTDSDFKKKSKRIKKLLSAEVFAFIEDLQPYIASEKSGKPVSGSNLLIISELDIIDKHRTLVVTAAFFRPTYLVYIRNEKLTPIPVTDEWRPFVNGAQIGSIDLSALDLGENDKVSMHFKSEVQVVIAETGEDRGGLYIDTLAACARYVTAVIDACGAKFFGE